MDHEELWESPLISGRGDQVIRFRFRRINGRLECIGVEVTREKHPITASFMRGVRWSELIDAKKRLNLKRAHKWAQRPGKIARTARERMLETDPELRKEAERMIPEWEASLGRRAGRTPEYGPDHFAAVARIYSDALASGLPPTREVGRRFNVSRSTAAKWVARARKGGLLPPTKQRVARGRPVGKGKR